MERLLNTEMQGGDRISKKDESYMIKDYIRTVAIKDYPGMKKSIVEQLDRIGCARERYFKFSQYREIRTYDSECDAVTRHMIYRRLTFRPDTYANLRQSVGVRYIGHGTQRVLKNRLCAESCPSIKYQYAMLRGISTVSVDRNDNGEYEISFNHNII